MDLQQLAWQLLAAVALAACSGDSAPAEPIVGADACAAPAVAPPASGTPQEPAADAAAPGPTLLRIDGDRELRALWLATVSGLDFPPAAAGEVAARARLQAIVDVTAKARLNAIFFQVRPESDALYESSLEPWSRFLTGTQGLDPGYDPLAILLELAHARGIEVHAWMNPYRAAANAADPLTPDHIGSVLAADAIRYGSSVVMNPGVPEVREWVLAVVDDLLGHYAVDGLHYDDYFYPYPDASNTPFPDAAQYAAYTGGGGTLPLREWRVQNVNALVRETGALVSGKHPSVRFGISPFGVYRPDPLLGISGLDAYVTLACDAPTWLAEGWVDYVAPQLYWPTTQANQAFGTLAGFWAQKSAGETQIFLGHALYQLGSAVTWSFEELQSQVAIGRGLRASGLKVGGSVFFRAASLEKPGVAEQFATRLFPGPAIPPELPRAARAGGAALPPQIRVGADGQLLVAADAAEFRALYTQSGGSERWTLLQVVGAAQGAIALPGPGTYALSNVMPGAVESLAVRVSY